MAVVPEQALARATEAQAQELLTKTIYTADRSDYNNDTLVQEIRIIEATLPTAELVRNYVSYRSFQFTRGKSHEKKIRTG